MTKVLVVDDTPDTVVLLARAVREQGYEALTAYDGLQALQLASTEQFDAILLDVMMPNMNGIEVLRRLKDDPALQAIPVILVTAKTEDSAVIEGLDAGAHDYVTKPFRREILAARLRSAVRSKQNYDSLQRVNRELTTEIAERGRVEKELLRAQKLEAVGQLAAGIAHEINTPAQFVGDNTRFLRDAFGDVDTMLAKLDKVLQAATAGEISDDLIAEIAAALHNTEVDYLKEEVPKAIQQSLEGIERVSHIVRAMKDFSHPGADHKQLVDLNRAIQSTLTVCRSEWKYVAKIVTDLAPDLPLVPCLAGDFNQVILNLVLNAAHAIGGLKGDDTQLKGTISIHTRQDGDWVEIRVEDTGPGIPAHIRDKVFNPFFTTKEVGKGTGLGLSLAYATIVKKHGGTIRFETGKGNGTAFIIRLPLTESVPATPSPLPAAADQCLSQFQIMGQPPSAVLGDSAQPRADVLVSGIGT